MLESEKSIPEGKTPLEANRETMDRLMQDPSVGEDYRTGWFRENSAMHSWTKDAIIKGASLALTAESEDDLAEKAQTFTDQTMAPLRDNDDPGPTDILRQNRTKKLLQKLPTTSEKAAALLRSERATKKLPPTYDESVYFAVLQEETARIAAGAALTAEDVQVLKPDKVYLDRLTAVGFFAEEATAKGRHEIWHSPIVKAKDTAPVEDELTDIELIADTRELFYHRPVRSETDKDEDVNQLMASIYDLRPKSKEPVAETDPVPTTSKNTAHDSLLGSIDDLLA